MDDLILPYDTTDRVYTLSKNDKMLIDDSKHRKKLIDELTDLLQDLKSPHVTRNIRNRLVRALNLCNALNIKMDSSLRIKLIKSTRVYLNKEDKTSINLIIKSAMDMLSQKSELKTSEDVNDLLEEFSKIAIETRPIDAYLDDSGLRVKDEITQYLQKYGVISSGYGLSGHIYIKGTHKEAEMERFIEERYPGLWKLCKYTLVEPTKYPECTREEDYTHARCRLNSESSLGTVDYISSLPDIIYSTLREHQNKEILIGDGTFGMFINRGKHHYLLTAAHVLLPSLSKISLLKQSEFFTLFNQTVKWAVCGPEDDLAIVELTTSEKHENFVKVAEVEHWGNYENIIGSEAALVFKLGSTTGLTFGEFGHDDDRIVAYNPYGYQNHIKVFGSDLHSISLKGDSGAIYYVKSDKGNIPIAIHRAFDKDEGCAYGSLFYPSLIKICKKLRWSVEEISVCQYQPCSSHY